MKRDFLQQTWDNSLQHSLATLVQMSVEEDLQNVGDLTSLALIPPDVTGTAVLRNRKSGVIAGLSVIPIVFEAVSDFNLQRHTENLHTEKIGEIIPQTVNILLSPYEGKQVAAGTELARFTGSIRTMLAAERVVLNLISHLSGVATLTRQYVDTIAGTTATIYDTRKTVPGYRLLEKYAVRCGGGRNHRGGLGEAILIKDNHLAALELEKENLSEHGTPVVAVRRARQFLNTIGQDRVLEIEVDDLSQLAQVLPEKPDIILLDNMSSVMLREAVAMRNTLSSSSQTELEASGGVSLETVRAIAETGVERISVGALTHSATALDIGLDWE